MTEVTITPEKKMSESKDWKQFQQFFTKSSHTSYPAPLPPSPSNLEDPVGTSNGISDREESDTIPQERELLRDKLNSFSGSDSEVSTTQSTPPNEPHILQNSVSDERIRITVTTEDERQLFANSPTSNTSESSVDSNLLEEAENNNPGLENLTINCEDNPIDDITDIIFGSSHNNNNNNNTLTEIPINPIYSEPIDEIPQIHTYASPEELSLCDDTPDELPYSPRLRTTSQRNMDSQEKIDYAPLTVVKRKFAKNLSTPLFPNTHSFVVDNDLVFSFSKASSSGMRPMSHTLTEGHLQQYSESLLYPEYSDKSDIVKSPPSKRQQLKKFRPNSTYTSPHCTSLEVSIPGLISSSATKDIAELIEREYKIKEGSINLFNVSKNLEHSMEAAKSFFTSNAKIISLMRQLQKSKKQEIEAKSDSVYISEDSISMMSSINEPEPCKAKISIASMRIPLEWKEFEDNRKCPVSGWAFCLLKIGDGEVRDTPNISRVDRTINDINLPETINFNELVKADFKIEIEVYFSQGHSPGTKDHISGMKGKHIKHLKQKKSSENSSNASPYASSVYPNIPKFHLAGHTSLSLQDIADGLYTYKLTKGAIGASASAATSSRSESLLPLWGQICCHIFIQPTCAGTIRAEGFINLHSMISGLPAWIRYWCVVKQNWLRCWNAPEDVTKLKCSTSCILKSNIELKRAEHGSIRRPYSLMLIGNDPSPPICIALDTKEERDKWESVLSQVIVDLRVWGENALKKQNIPDSNRSYSVDNKRVASPIESLRESVRQSMSEASKEQHRKKYHSVIN